METINKSENLNSIEPKYSQVPLTKATIILVISTLIMIAAGFSNFKFPPILLNVVQHYGIEMGAMSIIMSVFQWVSIFAMIPAGLLTSKLSPRFSGIIGLGCIVLGNVVALFASSLALLVIGRILEALGFCLIQVLTQSVITAVFRSSKFLGTATGIMNTGMMFGQIIHFNVAPRIVLSSGLNGVYTYIIVCIFVLAVFWAILISGNTLKNISSTIAEQEQKKSLMSPAERRAKNWSVYKTPQLWLVAIGFSLVGGAVARVGQFLPAYLTTELGIDSVKAGGLISISTAIGIAAFILYGMLSDALKTKRKLMIFSSLSVIVVFLCLMYLPAGLIMIFIILYGSLPRAFTTLTYSCYSDLFSDNEQTPIAHSVVHFTGNVIGSILTVVFGYIIQFSGYTLLWYFCIVLGILAAVCWYFAKKIK